MFYHYFFQALPGSLKTVRCVSHILIEFYRKLGLKLAWHDEDTAFFWIEKGKSWLGLWEGNEYETRYHPSLRHIAFRVSYKDLKESLKWLDFIQVEAVPFGNRELLSHLSAHTKVMLQYTDGNSLELICHIEVPNELKHITDKLSFVDLKKLVNNTFK